MAKTDSTAIPPYIASVNRQESTAGQDTTATSMLLMKDSVAQTESYQSANSHLMDSFDLPGFSLFGKEMKGLDGFFNKDSELGSQMGTVHDGVLGDPAPYSVSNDDTVAGALLVCFALAMLAASMSRNFILRQLKGLFHLPHRRTNVGETAYEVRFQLFLVVQTALMFSITYYLYNRSLTGGSYIFDSHLLIVGIYFAIFLGYFLIRYLLYSVVNWVYFPRRSNIQWAQFRLFLTSVEGVLLFPGVLLLIYFGVSIEYALIYVATVVILTKILTFYQGFVIFFKRTNVSLQIILYFCALELMPLTALLGILTYTGNYLTINF